MADSTRGSPARSVGGLSSVVDSDTDSDESGGKDNLEETVQLEREQDYENTVVIEGWLKCREEKKVSVLM